jgi:DNA-binding transcriptional MerR regulator
LKDLFTIGEISNLFEINIRTLRYYDEINLLKPEYTDSASKYRYYSTKQFERLNTIKYLRALNMPIAKILDFFENREIETLISMLKEQQIETAQKKHELELIERKIQNRIMQIEDAISTEYNIIEEKQIPYRNAGILKKKIMVGEDIEYPLVELGRMEQLNTAIFLGKVALSVDMEHLLANKFDEFASVMIIIEIEDPSADNRILIPEGDYLTLRFQGTHKEAREYYIKILNYAKEKNYIIAGNALEITMIDYGMTNNTQKFVTEIQIPYKKY